MFTIRIDHFILHDYASILLLNALISGAGAAAPLAYLDRWRRNPQKEAEKSCKAFTAYLRYDDGDNVWFTVEDLQKKFREHSCAAKKKRSHQQEPKHWERRFAFENDIVLAEKQYEWPGQQGYARGRSHEQSERRQQLKWSPWRVVSSWAGYEEDSTWAECGESAVTHRGEPCQGGQDHWNVMDLDVQIASVRGRIWHNCMSCGKHIIEYGAGDYATFQAEQQQSCKWRHIKQDDEGKQQKFNTHSKHSKNKKNILIAADTNMVAVRT